MPAHAPLIEHTQQRVSGKVAHAASFVAPSTRWEYDVFIAQVASHNVVRAEVSQDQKSAHLTFRDGTRRYIVLPSGYDHINYLLENGVAISIQKPDNLALFSPMDVLLLAAQVALFTRLVSIENKCAPCEEQEMCDTVYSEEPTGSVQSVQSLKSMESLDSLESLSPIRSTSMRNYLIMSMGGVVASDFVASIVKAVTDTYLDVSTICHILYVVMTRYDNVEVSIINKQQINKFATSIYSSVRYVRVSMKQLRRNIDRTASVVYARVDREIQTLKMD